VRVAITGASGYIGSHLAASLASQGHDVIELSRRLQGGVGQSWELGDDVSLAGVDVVVHCAFDFRNYAVNLIGAGRLYEAARRDGVATIIHLSSLAAFEGCRSLYGKTKLKVENLTTESGGISLRAGTVWGGKQGGPIGAIEARLHKSVVVPQLTGCSPFRLVHVDDLIALISRLIERRSDFRATYFSVASSDVVEFKELLALMAHRAGLRRVFVPIPSLLVQAGLQMVESLGVQLSLRSDAIRNLRHGNPAPDLALPEALRVPLRSIRGVPYP
jgi:nucleoside-diphosphate-sugar epimerase